MSSETFFGWRANGKGQPLKWTELPLKNFDDDTVEMNITHCGVCGSDVHTIDTGWGPADYPCVVGHEIVGICTRVGNNVKNVGIGDRIGVGAQSYSCGKCSDCLNGDENICADSLLGMDSTYNGHYPSGDKTLRGDYRFVFKIPVSMTYEIAATFFCAGVTTYGPLKKANIQPDDRVDVIGIGGLGHFASQWITAMGAEAVALSHSNRKLEDTMKLGCHQYIVTGDEKEMKKNADTLTHIICTSSANDFDWSLFLNLLKNNGRFIMVAISETPLVGIPPLLLAEKQLSLSGSIIGSPRMIEDMLKFATTTSVKPWINRYSMRDAPAAFQAIRDGKPRYRIVLENEV